METKEIAAAKMKLRLTEELSEVSKQIDKLIDRKISLQMELRGLSNDPVAYLDYQSESRTFFKEKIDRTQLMVKQ